MASGLSLMKNRLRRDVDLIIEVRDARIPESSQNPLLQETELSSKPRLVVYAKGDLALEASNAFLRKSHENPLVLSKSNRRDFRTLLNSIKKSFSNSSSTADILKKHRVMVVGIPNVGKSTIINGLRQLGTGIGGKAVKTGNLPGVTRAVSELVCISRSPSIYLIDTPGILEPRIVNAEEGLKVALCGGIYDKTLNPFLMAEYLLFILIKYGNTEYLKFYRLDEHPAGISAFLEIASKRIGALSSNGVFDLNRAATHFIRNFRFGKFGRFTLDEDVSKSQ